MPLTFAGPGSYATRPGEPSGALKGS
ncbi:MAG: hypothetical protein QOI81_1334, partial [Actinomycetota bacterium]|nr:hypothetical protein [Actinomycetota bacterium]